MVYEEKFIGKYNVPALQAVGWEGTFGFLTLATLLIPFYFIPDPFGQHNNPRGVVEDAYDGLYQLAHNPLLATAFCGTVVRTKNLIRLHVVLRGTIIFICSSDIYCLL